MEKLPNSWNTRMFAQTTQGKVIPPTICFKKGLPEGGTFCPMLFRTRTSFALSRSALFCLRGSRTRRVPCDINNVDIDVEVVEGAIQSDCWCVSLLLNGKLSSLTHCVLNAVWFSSFLVICFLAIILVRMQLTLKIVPSFFSPNESFLIWIILFIGTNFCLIKTKCFF